MPTYPSLPTHPDGHPVPRDGRKEDFAVSGAPHIRNFQSADKFAFQLRHERLTTAQLATLQAFYNANRSGTFDYVWPADGTTYTGVKFGEGGLEKRWRSEGRFDVTVRLIGP
jgi:hypothetical protein